MGEKEELISHQAFGIVWQKNCVRLVTLIVIIHIFDKHVKKKIQLICTELFYILQGVCERCRWIGTNDEYLCCKEITTIPEWILKMNYQIWWVFEGSSQHRYEFVDRDGPLDNNEPIHKSGLQDANIQVKPRHFLECWLWCDYFQM